MVDPGAITGNIVTQWQPIMNQIMWWTGRILAGLFGVGICVGVYFWLQYRYKVTIFERGGSGNEDDKKSHFIRKITKDRARPIKSRSGEIEGWQLLKTRKKIQPVEMEHIYPGNNVYLYRVTEGVFVPTDFVCQKDEATFNPIPQTIRRWQELEIKQAFQDYKVEDLWDKYGNYAVTAATVLFCCILVGVTVYLTYKNANQVVSALDRVNNGIATKDIIKGIAPK